MPWKSRYRQERAGCSATDRCNLHAASKHVFPSILFSSCFDCVHVRVCVAAFGIGSPVSVVEQQWWLGFALVFFACVFRCHYSAPCNVGPCTRTKNQCGIIKVDGPPHHRQVDHATAKRHQPRVAAHIRHPRREVSGLPNPRMHVFVCGDRRKPRWLA